MTCRELGARLCPGRLRRGHLLRRLLRALWAGKVPRALRALTAQRRRGADPAAVEELSAYLQARAAWIPDYRARRCQRRYIGNGLGEQSSDALAALRTLLLNGRWECYWQGRQLLHPSVAA